MGIHDERTLDNVTWIVANYLKENSYNALTLEVAEYLLIQISQDDQNWYHMYLHALVDAGLPFQKCLDVEHGKKHFFADTTRALREAALNFGCDKIIYGIIQQDFYTQCLITTLTTDDIIIAQGRINRYAQSLNQKFLSGKASKIAELRMSYLDQVLYERRPELTRPPTPAKRPETIEEYLMREYEKLSSARGLDFGDEIFDEMAQSCSTEHLSPEEIRQICQAYVLDAELFKDPDPDNLQMKRNLLCSLKQLSRSNLDPLSRVLFSEMTHVSLDLIEQQRPDLAEAMIDGMYIAGSILSGAASEYVFIRGVNELAKIAIKYGPYVGRLHPYAATAITIGFVGYQIYSNFNEIIDSFEKASKLWEKGEYFKLGQMATDTAYNVSLFNSLYRTFHTKNAIPSLIDGLKTGVQGAKKVEALERESKNLVKKVKASNGYNTLYEAAKKSGTSEVAMERRIDNLSRICTNSDTVLNRLGTINELMSRPNIEMPGLGKKVKYNFDHLLKLDMAIKNGNLINIGGFHIDPGCMITNSGKIEVIGKEMGPGGIWRAILRVGCQQKKSSFFPEHMNAEQVFSLCDNILRTLDVTKLNVGKNGKILEKIPTELGFYIAFSIQEQLKYIRFTHGFPNGKPL